MASAIGIRVYEISISIPTQDQLENGCAAFRQHERRDAMYKTATFLVDHYWGRPVEMADGLGVLLLTWNQAFYRYGAFDFGKLEGCIAKNITVADLRGISEEVKSVPLGAVTTAEALLFRQQVLGLQKRIEEALSP
jgi:hypothetical protein